MTKRNCVVFVTLFALAASAAFAGHDYYKHLRYPSKLVPGVGVDKIEQEGGPDAVGYRRRTVTWWPRKGQDFVDVPEGAPLRTWTRNKGQEDKEALAGLCRNWTASDPETFKAHLIALRAFGTNTPVREGELEHIPCAVLRMPDGRPRAVIDYGPVGKMISREDHAFIHKVWAEAFPKLYAKVDPDERVRHAERSKSGIKMELYEAPRPRFNTLEWRKENAKYPLRGETDKHIVFETPHYTITSLKTPRETAGWINPDSVKHQTLRHKNTFEHCENFWTYVQAAGLSMPFWRREGPNPKYAIFAAAGGAGGGYGGCGIGGASLNALGHEFFHGHDWGGWDQNLFGETMCNAGQHLAMPGELQMFSGNFRHPWRNVNVTRYQSSLWCFVLGDNPNWGYGIPIVCASLGGGREPTAYHTIARLGQKKGLWKNGIKGFGDFFGEYAARMVALDMVEQDMIRSRHGMPLMSHVYPVYGRKNTYRVPNSEAPNIYGFNIIRLIPEEGTRKISVDFHGFYDPGLHSDWRVCIVAVDGEGRARYSPMWNKGKMTFALKPSDRRTWLTVAATPSAMWTASGKESHRLNAMGLVVGINAPIYPWEMTLGGCRPGTPNRMQGDVINHDELYAINNGNKYLDHAVKHEVPVPLDAKDGKLAQEKLADMLKRIEAATNAFQEKVKAGKYNARGWWEMRKTEFMGDLRYRAQFLQRNGKGHRHPNGGGFVADSARVAETAYVGPNAMVLDGAQVKDHACIKEFAVVTGPKTVVSGHAKIGGRAWVCGDLKIGGNARILETATVVTRHRRRWHVREGAGEITGNAVIKGFKYVSLSNVKDQVLTGGIVTDYSAGIESKSGTFGKGRFCVSGALDQGVDAGALYANYEFDQPKAFMLEDSYVNNNGILHGGPTFEADGEHRCVVFNGKDQYAEAPPSDADFGELTIDVAVNPLPRQPSAQCLFDFGTGEDECFYLEIADGGKPTLVARHAGKSMSLPATQAIPAGKWTRVRVAINGSEAFIYIDGKPAAKGAFAFRPRDVFIGDRPEGNFIACARNGDRFFQGKMDHFRIYRKVHEDFDALGKPPFPMVQNISTDAIEKAKELAAEWDRRAKERRAALDESSGYNKWGKKIETLQEERKQAKSDEERAALDKKIKEESAARHQLWWQNNRAIGGNPYSGLAGGEAVRRDQQNLLYHTTVDWDGRLREEIEGKVTPRMKKWLEEVRGY